VEDPHLADGNPITDEVKVDLHMLGPLVPPRGWWRGRPH
jgi:hypothetical protein